METERADQAQGQSVEDRIFAQFGELEQESEVPKAAEPQEEPEEQPEEETAEVEYDGERFRVPKKLEKAILQEADYTRKTQDIANERRLLEQSQSTIKVAMMEHEFHQSLAKEFHQLKSLEDYIQNLEGADYNQMDSDSIVRHLATIQKAKAGHGELSKLIESRQKEFGDKRQSYISELKAKSHETLAKLINGYTPEKFKEVRAYGSKSGFTDDVLDSIEADPRAASVLYKAMRFDQLQNDKSAAVRKLDAPVVKPGASKPMPTEVKDKLNYRKALGSAKTKQERDAIVAKRIESMF